MGKRGGSGPPSTGSLEREGLEIGLIWRLIEFGMSLPNLLQAEQKHRAGPDEKDFCRPLKPFPRTSEALLDEAWGGRGGGEMGGN